MPPFVIGIRFHRISKIYHFDASNYPDIKIGDFAVVDTNRGKQLGEVVSIIEKPSLPQEGGWKTIKRKATPRDLVLRQIWEKKEVEAIIVCRQKIAKIGLEGVKVVAAEYCLDGEKLTFIYSSEGDEKLDLKKLKIALKHEYPKTHIELKQVGPRDVAKYIGGMGACGMDMRCCSLFLTEFSPISIKMAKEQDLSLTPSEITGMCGRLRCCLVYEYEQYKEAHISLPKRGRKVQTPMGEGKVVEVSTIKLSVIVDFDHGIRQEFQIEEIQPWDEADTARKSNYPPCIDHPDGNCKCQQRASSE